MSLLLYKQGNAQQQAYKHSRGLNTPGAPQLGPMNEVKTVSADALQLITPRMVAAYYELKKIKIITSGHVLFSINKV